LVEFRTILSPSVLDLGAPPAAVAPNFVPFAQHPPKIGRAAIISDGSLIA
jgi:hypothetical protein